jgi:hypothetical protein
LGEFVAFDKDHEDEPAFPNCLPAGFAVGRAGEKAAQAGDTTQEVPVGGEALCRLLKLGGEDPDRRFRHVRRGGAVAPGGIAQAEETNGDNGQSAEQRHQPIGLLQLPLLGPAAGFPGFVTRRAAQQNSSTVQRREYQAMISSAWSRVSTGRVVSSSHSKVPFQTRTPDTRIGARPAGPLRGGRSSSSRQATQTTA